MAERKLADDSGEDQHTGQDGPRSPARERNASGPKRRSRVSRTQRERPWGVLSHWSLLIS
jgi:hypothetical protein